MHSSKVSANAALNCIQGVQSVWLPVLEVYPWIMEFGSFFC